MAEAAAQPVMARWSPAFRRFYAAQSVSSLGGALSRFALPLLVYQMTGSAMQLAVITAAQYLPYLCFGLLIGAWVDRLDRRRLMLLADLLRAPLLLSLPLLWHAGMLALWWVYLTAFLVSAFGILFNAAEFAALPALVPRALLARANGRIQASYALMNVLGPILGGVVQGSVALPLLFVAHALCCLVSAWSVATIRIDRAGRGAGAGAGILGEIGAGLRYVWRDPVLRAVSLLLAGLNFLTGSVSAQLVLFSKEVLRASDMQLGVLLAAGSVGAALFALAAQWCIRRVAPGHLILLTVGLHGLTLVGFAASASFWLSVALWAATNGLVVLCGIAARLLRQASVPNELLGRVITVAEVLAWSAIPFGTLLGAALLRQPSQVVALYMGIGAAVMLLAGAFSLSPLGRKQLITQEVC